MLTTDGRVLRTDDERRFHLSGAGGAAAGLVLAVAMLSPLVLLSKLAGMQFLAVQLGFIGAIYFGFGIADGRALKLLVEFLVAGTFLFVAVAALWANSPTLLAAAYAAHAVWDLLHHPRAVTMPVRNWYPPFCVTFDLISAAFVLAWLPLAGVH